LSISTYIDDSTYIGAIGTISGATDDTPKVLYIFLFKPK